MSSEPENTVEVHIEPDGFGYYPDEEIRERSYDCIPIVDHDQGAAAKLAGTFACEYTTIHPGEDMFGVANRVRLITTDELEQRIRQEELPEELSGASRRAVKQDVSEFVASNWGADDQPEAHGADLAMETRTHYVIVGMDASGDDSPENIRTLDIIVYLDAESDEAFRVVDYQEVQLPEDFPSR